MIDPVTVYQYTYWDPDAGVHKTSTLFATFEMIRSGLGQPIGTTGIYVERASLRDGGIYVPQREKA